jgi:iron(III) transport system permease protein
MREDRSRGSRTVFVLVALGVLGFFLLPWYAIEDGFFSTEWILYYPRDPELAPAVLQGLVFDRAWLLPIALFVLAPLLTARAQKSDARAAWVLILAGSTGLFYSLAQGFLIGPLGWTSEGLESAFGPFAGRQYGMGYGALVVHTVLALYVAEGFARRGAIRGDSFVVGTLTLVFGSVIAFVFFPVAVISLRAFETDALLDNILVSMTWAGRSLLLAVLAGAGCTLLGLAFALVATRTNVRGKRFLRALTVLPIITPPFVIGLALILTFGRAGAVTLFLEQLGIAPSRYIFGLPGILLAQLLSMTPIAFLVLIGVVEGVSPSMEEAAQTLRADRFRTFFTVSLPLMRPGLANAFLLCFIESLADFGNPLVLGGSYEVLSTQIYFSVAGAQNDIPKAAAGAMVLLVLTVGAFIAQQRWVGRGNYTTVTGKADSGAPAKLPKSVERLAIGVAFPWAIFTAAVYGLVFFGGFVKIFGRDNTFTLAHYAEIFAPSTGAGWSSLWTTIGVSIVSAPLTALIGLAAAYLIARQQFFGKRTFELLTMLSFAIPGTVIGVAYVLAFNDPPLEMTGTGALLVVCFVFRNMPVGLRAGIATLSQIDKSLDEASLTLGAGTASTVRRVVMPLLKPALIAALVYGFVRAMTAVSAVIFLVSADYDLATTYILGRVEGGAYGPAIAYSSVLIVLMIAAIGSIQLLVGRRDVGRRGFVG